jgi:hypothetical protein
VYGKGRKAACSSREEGGDRGFSVSVHTQAACGDNPSFHTGNPDGRGDRQAACRAVGRVAMYLLLLNYSIS